MARDEKCGLAGGEEFLAEGGGSILAPVVLVRPWLWSIVVVTALYVQIRRGLMNGGPASLPVTFTLW